MENRSMFVGLDVHKETIDVSIAEGHRNGEVRHYGVIASDLEPLAKVVRALRAPNRRLHFVSEAGPCGFGIYRHLTQCGEACAVVSPSMVPKRSGDRVKTDRRDIVRPLPGCIARANSARSTCRTTRMKRCAIWCARGKTPS
jgi:transposase